MLRLFYNRNHTFNKLFWFFWNYFQDASMPSAENLFLLVISMLALDSFRSIRFAWMHIDSSVFLSIDDTLVEKYGTKFQARSNLFDHAAHSGSNYLKGHCFVSLMLHVPLKSADGITYLSVPLGYRLWTKELSNLELAANPGKPGGFRLFLCTAAPEEIAVEPEK